MNKCEEAKEEWPQVGDEVETSYGNGVVKLLPDSKGYYVVSINGEYYQYQLDELSKPKTPEEELCDDIADIIDNASCSEQAAEYIVKTYLTLNTKKPQ